MCMCVYVHAHTHTRCFRERFSPTRSKPVCAGEGRVRSNHENRMHVHTHVSVWPCGVALELHFGLY